MFQLKKIVICLIAIFSLSFAFSQSNGETVPQVKKTAASKKKKKKVIRKKSGIVSEKKTIALVEKDTVSADSLLDFSKKHLGTKYRYAVCDPEIGFDCSGFVYYVFGHFGKKVPRSSIEYISFGQKINKDSCKKGDVIVFTGTNAKNRRAGHVGIVISELGEELRFIHCSSNKKRGGVIISSYKESPYYEKRFLRISRVAIVK